MLVRMYSVFDKKIGSYQAPVTAHNVGHALRMFHSFCSNPDNPINKYHQDYDVYDLGEFDDVSGQIKPHTNPQFISSVTDILEIKDND